MNRWWHKNHPLRNLCVENQWKQTGLRHMLYWVVTWRYDTTHPSQVVSIIWPLRGPLSKFFLPSPYLYKALGTLMRTSLIIHSRLCRPVSMPSLLAWQRKCMETEILGQMNRPGYSVTLKIMKFTPCNFFHHTSGMSIGGSVKKLDFPEVSNGISKRLVCFRR